MTVTATPVIENLQDTLRRLNLTESEYSKITGHLGRDPNFNELAMFSVLWSEHCCYKNSRHLLKKFPTTGPRILQGPGENAGVVDIGDGISVAFKIESHNHPTAVEPFQGAATGVGGILRDIFTMNARPVANLNSLRFGPLTDHPNAVRNRYLFTRAVEGIAHYGNCVGVPTVGGEVFFDETYSGNPLVNAMAVGVLYDNELMASGAKGIGNPVLYVGSATGKDGMGGAAFASRELDEKSNADRPAVQVGDPFSEKLLIESCLEAFKSGLVESAQDMGAAGLTCSGAEMAAKGGVGMLIDLDKVPAREPDMLPFEYLLSESQERMLMVLKKGQEQPVIDIFKKWGVPAVIVGEVTGDGLIRFTHKGQEVVNVPAALLTDLAPSYKRGENPQEPEAAKARRTRQPEAEMPDIAPDELEDWVNRLFTSPNIARPVGVFRQYDRHVRNNTLLSSDHNGGGVIRLRKKDGSFSGRAVAVTADCNSRFVYLEPYMGSMAAVAQAARNLVCTGAEPLAVTDNLNFGNPEKPDIYYQMYFAVEGISEACKAFATPVTGGNVSLYNEHSGEPICPAPVIGMVGLIEDDTRVMSPGFKQAGHQIALVGRFKPSLGGSEYQKRRTGESFGEPPSVAVRDEKALHGLILSLIREQKIASVQDVSMGGLLTTLIECTFSLGLDAERSELGLDLTLGVLKEGRLDAVLFGETNGSYIVSYAPEQEAAVQAACQSVKTSFVPLGQVTDQPILKLDGRTISLETAFNAWRTTLDF